jgi:MerR family Zn(II)-responsive transcriptional regulator of zntA
MRSETTIETDPFLKIGDFARLADTNLRTLRYYEEIGLLEPVTRSSGGFRYYRTEDANRLRMIQTLQGLGLELSRIRELMDTRAEGLPRERLLARVRGALDRQTELLDERIRELSRHRESLEAARRKLAGCADCPHRPETENNFCNPCLMDGQDLPPELSALF